MHSERRKGRDPGSVLLVLGFAVLAGAQTWADPDLWGHVRFGELFLSAGEITRSDPYSYLTEGQTWINHEWLAEVVFAWSHGVGGPAGLVALKLLIVLAMLAIAYRHLCRRGLDTLRAGMLVVLLIALIQIGIATVRPHVFTYFLFFLVVLALEAADRGRPRWLWGLPPLFALWANLHGGFLAGLGVLGVWTAARVAAGLWSRGGASETQPRTIPSAWWLAGVLVASAGATLINPYGAELLAFLGRTALVPRPEITEWQPVRITSLPGLWYVLFVTLLGAALVRSRRPIRPAGTVVLAVSALVPLLAIRHLPLFALAGVGMGAEHLASAFGRRDRAGIVSPGGGSKRRAVQAVLALGGVALSVAAVPKFGCIELEEGYYPVRAVGLLEASGTTGNLAVFFNWGEYAIWHLVPEMRVSMDGRRETVYPDSIYAEHLRWVQGIGDWDALLERRPTDVALVPRGGPTYNLLSLRPGWVPVHADSVAGLFAREGWSALDALRTATSGSARPGAEGRCFP